MFRGVHKSAAAPQLGDKVIGSMPKNRESSDPINFLTNVFENNDVLFLTQILKKAWKKS